MADPRPIRSLLAVLALMATAGAAAGCSAGRSALTSPAGARGPRPEVMVTMGGIETSNLDVRIDRRDSWTQLVFNQALPAAAVSYDLAADNITAERVIDDQLPELASLHPDVVTIWVEGADVRLATPAAEYQTELDALVGGARRAGARQVLLLTPPAEQADLAGGLEPAVAAAAAASGATLVVLPDTSDRYSDAGQRAIAGAVLAAMHH